MKKLLIILAPMLILSFVIYHVLAIKEYSDIEFKIENTSEILHEAYMNYISPIERRDFIKKVKRPDWFADKPAKVVSNIAEVQELWSSKKRCCVDKEILLENNREFFRGCYNGVINNFTDEKLVVKCLSLMSSTSKDKDQRYIMNNYIVDNYVDHKNDISKCVNCGTGDTVTRTIKTLARQELALGNASAAMDLLEGILRDRNDAALWIQVEALEQLGELYLDNEFTLEQKDFINKRFDGLLKASESNKAAKKRIPKLQEVMNKINIE